MHEKDGKQKIKRFFGSRLFLFIGIPLAILVSLTYIRAYYSGYKINQEIAALEEEKKSYEFRKLELVEMLKYVSSEEFVEEKARMELNMKKEGENVIVFKNDNPDNGGQKTENDSTRQKISNPLKWWYYFTNKEYIENNN